MRRFVAIGPALVVLFGVAAVMLAGPAAIRQMVFASETAEVMLARQVLDEDDILERIDRAVGNIATAVRPSVTHIEVTVRENRGYGRGSSGSGWVYDTEGHIITNSHVVSEADSIRVEFPDGRSMQGEVLASDAFTDIAVLKVDPGIGLIPARRATDERVTIGQRVFAFGSPFNFKFSMSQGIVSGLGRNPQTSGSGDTFTNYIQTDAAVNPGNSGGPLVNVRGEVIGMNVAIATGNNRRQSEGQSAGISFAIPLGVIESVVEQIITTGEVKRGYLGISPTNYPVRAIEDESGDYQGRGIMIGEVVPNLAADQAGIEEDDIISEINGHRITEWHQLRSVVTTAMPGSEVIVKLWRDGKELELPVKLAEFPVGPLYRRTMERELFEIGMGVRDGGGDGVYIDFVRADSLASELGFVIRDRIVEADGQEVEDLLGLYGVLARSNFLEGEAIDVVVVNRDGERETMSLKSAR